MKKSILSIALAAAGTAGCFAAKAYPGAISVTQEDGTQLTIYIHGDENFNWITTEDGILLKQVGKNYYIAETTTNGLLKATKHLAHNAVERSSAEAKAIKRQDIQKFLSSTNEEYVTTKSNKAIGTAHNGVKYFPHTGSPKALVILAEFSDTVFVSGTKAKNVFEHFLKAKQGDALPDGYETYTGSYKKTNMRNYGSVSDYFYTMSKGAFTPQFDVVGPFNLGKSSYHYGKGNEDGSQLVKDACAAAYENGVDFSQYDADGDGDVDLVYVIYAGYPASMSGNDDDIWPKAIQNSGGFCKYNGKNIKRSGIHAERNLGWAENQTKGYLVSGIGLFCHEFSHTMGLPDLYPSSSSAQVDNQNPEYWDLMDGGEYTYNGGYWPSPYSPWEMDVMGWESPVELEDKSQQVTLEPYHESRTAYKINGENNEYLLVQNCQAESWWRGMCGIYNHGMLVWRIDYDKNDVNLFDFPNNIKGKPKVMIVPADGYVISDYQVRSSEDEDLPWTQAEYSASLKGDPFPGSTNVTQLLSVTLNKSTLQKPIYNIQESEDGIITFDYLNDPTSEISSPIVAKEQNTKIFTLDGRYIGKDIPRLNKGIYIVGGKKVVIK